MRFGRIDRILLLGGSPLIAEAARELAKSHEVAIFSCARQLEERMDADGTTLEQLLRKNGTKYFCADDINSDKNFLLLVSPTTLAIGIGEAWTFTPAVLRKFNGRLVDLMGIRLPKFRGGAHYTWQILMNDHQGCCNIQEVNEEMVPGGFDSGAILKRKEYQLSASAKIPMDYFREAGRQELAFILEFVREVKEGKSFMGQMPDESQSLFMPRLYTKEQGYINWQWDAKDIEKFIRAFDDPYAGASTFAGGRRVFLKKARLAAGEGEFHPFQAGLIFRTHGGEIFVAAAGGALAIKGAQDEKGKSMISSLKAGERLHTPTKYLEHAMEYSANYSTKGIARKKK